MRESGVEGMGKSTIISRAFEVGVVDGRVELSEVLLDLLPILGLLFVGDRLVSSLVFTVAFLGIFFGHFA